MALRWFGKPYASQSGAGRTASPFAHGSLPGSVGLPFGSLNISSQRCAFTAASAVP